MGICSQNWNTIRYPRGKKSSLHHRPGCQALEVGAYFCRITKLFGEVDSITAHPNAGWLLLATRQAGSRWLWCCLLATKKQKLMLASAKINNLCEVVCIVLASFSQSSLAV
jgi:hypothetical protein